MFKLPNGIPNARTPSQDWADYAEYFALSSGKINLLDLAQGPKLVSDEDMVLGVEDDTDKFIQLADDIANEIRLRINICGDQYPFFLSDKDYILNLSSDACEKDTAVYRYLLMATRSNMSRDRIQDNIDGALLFEELCSSVAQNYFGPRAEVDILGTSKKDVRSFRDKLRYISTLIGEGGEIHENTGHKPQDDNVDVIVWKGFKDGLVSKLIAFGQCKTGTSWSDRLSELNTEAFCKTWFTRQPILTPVRMFFTAQYFPREIFYVRAAEAGLVFDRFRILDYLPEDIDQNLLDRIINWTQAIYNHYNN